MLAPVTRGVSGNMRHLQAIDASSRAIPGQTVTLSGNGIAEFRSPGIAALHATGTGTVGPCSAIGEADYANLPDWQKIQTVGLPLKKDEIGTAYNTKPQGFEPPGLDGVQAAELRGDITALLQVDPPGTGIADFPLPAWPVPNIPAYVAWLRGAKSLVPMIERCLQNSVDTNPAKLQADYTETVSLAGHQAGKFARCHRGPDQTFQGEAADSRRGDDGGQYRLVRRGHARLRHRGYPASSRR